MVDVRTGLSEARAAALLEEHGRNEPPVTPPPTVLHRILGQLRDPMILLLLAAFVVVVAIGDGADALIIAAVVVVNTTIGVVQEVRAENAVAALRSMASPHALVVRDGRARHVPAAEVVPGDLLRLDAGDVVPADAELVEAVTFEVDESAMTGESVPVGRATGDDVLAGTVVTRGRGLGVVRRTGADSGLGRIAAAVVAAGTRPTPLQQRLSRLSRQLVVAVVVIAVLVMVLGVARGQDVVATMVLAVSLAVAAIPESLPAVVSVALAMGAYRMARRAAVVRWLPSVETLGSVSVLATDKTGTLTEGRMVVERLWVPGHELEVTGRGYEVAGTVEGARAAEPRLGRLLRDAVLCNDAELGGPDDGTWRVVGDPLEGALLVCAAKRGLRADELAAMWPRVGEEPFDAVRRRMTTVHRTGHGRRLTVVKGAPESLLPELADAPLEVDAARETAHDLAGRGYRVLAVADREDDGGLHLAGLAAVADPPRPGAADVVEACRRAGVRTVMITGDHPATAHAIAERLGITRWGPDVVDAEHDALDPGASLERVGVYARVRPDQKLDILRAWQSHGHVVAMTGDGVNDAPALRGADIGVAMGDRGTEVARQAASLVLADDELGTVVVAIGEGRRIYANIRTFLRYGLAGGLAEVLVLLGAPFLGLALPLTPAMILWINLVTHGVPGVAFGGEPMDPGVMSRPSPPPSESVLHQGLARQIAWTGALIAVVSTAAGLLADARGVDAQTVVFLVLGLSQLTVALALRTPRPQRFSLAGRALELSVLGAGLLQVLGVWWAPLRGLLGTEPVSATVLLAVAVAAALPGLAVAVSRRRPAPRPTP